MIALVNKHASKEQLAQLVRWIEQRGLKAHVSHGADVTIVGLVGDTTRVDPFLLESMDLIDRVERVSEPFKLASRSFHPADTTVDCGHGVTVGGGDFQLVAHVSSSDAGNESVGIEALRTAGATMLCVRTHQSLTNPHVGAERDLDSLDLLLRMRTELDIPLIVEVADVRDVWALVDSDIDVLRIAARNAQNVALLREVGATRTPILLEHGLGGTIDELLMAAEHIMSEGNAQVILCERGMRGFDRHVPYTFDVNQLTVLRQLTHLPVIVDPIDEVTSASAMLGIARAAAVLGADGVVIALRASSGESDQGVIQGLTPAQVREEKGRIELAREPFVESQRNGGAND